MRYIISNVVDNIKVDTNDEFFDAVCKIILLSIDTDNRFIYKKIESSDDVQKIYLIASNKKIKGYKKYIDFDKFIFR